MRSVAEWLNWLDSDDWQRWARRVYGRAWMEQRNRFRQALIAAAQRWSEQAPVFLVRSPGRLNLMGRHIDHRGGFVHPIALPREITLVAQPCEDDLVAVHHVQPNAFPSYTFRISEVAPSRPLGADEWERWTHQHASERKRLAGWAIYAEAAAATLANWRNALFGGSSDIGHKSLHGINAIVFGDILPEAGLSSSSALFIAFLLALLHVNSPVHYLPSLVPLAEVCGYGEWFVGTRGGAGDHAAILLAEQGKVLRIGFFPLTVQHFPFPEDVCLLVMDSGERAHKAGNARLEFNLRVAAYEIGMMLWREHFPNLRDRLQHLRDATPSRLGDIAWVYRLLHALPERVTLSELLSLLPHSADRLHQLVSSVLPPSPIPHTSSLSFEVRGICWYGIAECERSERFGAALQRGDLHHLGELMSISHDGDRVVRWRNGNAEGYRFPTDDKTLKRLEEESVPIWRQGGSYRCSTPAIDFLVDASLRAGALGAQISGAGLGGCLMALVQRGEAERIAHQVALEYEKTFGKELTQFVAEPCHGAQVINRWI